MTTPSRHEAVVLTVTGCHLCEDAVRAVAAVCDEVGAGWREQDLFELPDDDVRRWRDFVPVVLVDGSVVDTLRVDPARLRAALSSGRPA